MNRSVLILIGLITALSRSVAPATSYTVTLSSDRAVYVDRSAPDTNQQGDRLVNRGWYSSANTARTYIAFDLTSIPANATVTSVTMTVYKAATNSGNPIMDLKAVSQDWDEDTITFTTRPSFDSTTYASATIASEDPVGTAYEFSTPEFLGLVQSWINGTVANYGVMFEQASTSNTVAFYSDEASNADYRPKLTVTYDAPEPATLRGTVIFEGYIGDNTTAAVTFDLQAMEEGEPVLRTVLLEDDGSFALDNIAMGVYRLVARGQMSLSTTLDNVPILTNPTVLTAPLVLRGGDINGDDHISFEDFAILQNSYGQSGSAGANPLAAAATGGCGAFGFAMIAILGLAAHGVGLRKVRV